MNNVFVVGTPLQLMAAYIMAAELFGHETNQLVLIHPQKDQIWHSSYSLRTMSEDTAVWRQVISMDKWLSGDYVWRYPGQMRQLREKLDSFGRVDNICLGSDKIIQNQLLVELLGRHDYVRIEDGIWSYHNRDRRKLSKVWQLLRIKFFRSIGGITGSLRYNLGGVGHGMAAAADYLFKPQLLERYSPQAVCIEQTMVRRVMAKLVRNMEVSPAMSGTNYLLFLGSTFVERKVISEAEEKVMLAEIFHMAGDCGLHMIYKPHPRESSEKIAGYARHFPKMTIVRINDPIEVIYAKYSNLRWALSISSSGLLFADVFSENITPVALFKLYSVSKGDRVLARMMEKAGVFIPESITELKNRLAP